MIIGRHFCDALTGKANMPAKKIMVGSMASQPSFMENEKVLLRMESSKTEVPCPSTFKTKLPMYALARAIGLAMYNLYKLVYAIT